jgi:hypothetical protein
VHAHTLRQIESLGFLTSVHRMGDYCELHAAKLPDGEPVYIARSDADTEDGVSAAACELARMCGVDLEG